MRTAAGCGIPAARTEIGQCAEREVIIVERFDRFAGGTARIHQEDMCQALALPPRLKYQRDGGPSPEDIADLLRTADTPDSLHRTAVRLGVDPLLSARRAEIAAAVPASLNAALRDLPTEIAILDEVEAFRHEQPDRAGRCRDIAEAAVRKASTATARPTCPTMAADEHREHSPPT